MAGEERLGQLSPIRAADSFENERDVQTEATLGVYQRMIGAYREAAATAASTSDQADRGSHLRRPDRP